MRNEFTACEQQRTQQKEKHFYFLYKNGTTDGTEIHFTTTKIHWLFLCRIYRLRWMGRTGT